MTKNLKAATLRNDILDMKKVIERFAGRFPDSQTRKEILYLINDTCVHKVIDRSEIEDIDNGQFRYAIQANRINNEIEDYQEVIVKFN